MRGAGSCFTTTILVEANKRKKLLGKQQCTITNPLEINKNVQGKRRFLGTQRNTRTIRVEANESDQEKCAILGNTTSSFSKLSDQEKSKILGSTATFLVKANISDQENKQYSW